MADESPVDVLRVRLNCVDHYQSIPTDFDPDVFQNQGTGRRKDLPNVSVIRVFGATESGQKVCLHVHGVFQYLFIEYVGSLDSSEGTDISLRTTVSTAARNLHQSIDHALAVSYRRNAYDGKSVFVAHISLVRGIPFYGYHVGYKYFFKIYMLNPLNMTRLGDLLREGAVMKRSLQPYESHMQYLAQWMCDYNLYGCAYIDCGKVKFRGPVPRYEDIDNPLHQWHDRSIASESIIDETVLAKQSHCPLEADVCAQDILNRQGTTMRPLHHDFSEMSNPLPPDIKLVQSMAGLWKDETRRRKRKLGLADPNSSPFPAEVLISMSADPRNTEAGGWIHEEEFREKVAELANDEYRKSDMKKLSFDSFTKTLPHENLVKTVFESVEDLYPENLAKIHTNDFSTLNREGSKEDGEIQVDESRILGLVNGPISIDSEEDHIGQPDRRAPSMPEIAEDAGVQLSKRHDRQAMDGETSKSSSDAEDAKNGSSTVRTPTSSSEYASLGIRKQGDFSHIEEDAFELPSDAFTADKSKLENEIDRPRSRHKPIKRKFLIDEDNFRLQSPNRHGEEASVDSVRRKRSRLYDDMIFDDTENLDNNYDEDDMNESTSQHDRIDKLRLQNSQRSLRASFPTVKDPNDLNTKLRLSQRSNTSTKLSQSDSNLPAYTDRQVTSLNGTTIDKPKKEHSVNLLSPGSPGEISPFPTTFKGLSPSFSRSNIKTYAFRKPPPSRTTVIESFQSLDLPTKIYQEAYYSDERDVPDRARDYAGREFKLQSDGLLHYPDFESYDAQLAVHGSKPAVLIDHYAEEVADHQSRKRCHITRWRILEAPPSQAAVSAWSRLNAQSQNTSISKGGDGFRKQQLSQIEGPTQKNKHGFKYSQRQASTSVQHETQYMSVMSLEVHVNTRGSLAPDPEKDEVSCIFWSVQSDDEDLDVNGTLDGTHVGILCLSEIPGLARKIGRDVSVTVEEEANELDLLTRMVDIVRFYDPDIITGYEVHNSSWGYLIERARFKYDYNLCDEFSRMRSHSHGRFGKENDRWGFNHTSTIRVTGRHMINIWRAMRGELNLLQYTMENVVFHLLHRRIPHYPFKDLSQWYKSGNSRDLSKVVGYYLSRVQMDLEILEANELIPRTSEQARLLGVDFFSVFSRGSQFKVESLMFRIAKPENFILVSPSRRQVGGQNALECLPLVMEPQSDFYTSPMLVLDFQSLYPSVMIAYNYCYSTFLGRIVSWRGQNKMGFTHFQRQQRLLELLKDHINIAPNGIMYAKTQVRRSLLAKMLSEILETRVMVKSGMKVDKDDKTLQRLLNNRQLALKLIANVTYGYTSASFSGRMPCSEIADSIVQTGRETLEKAIALIHSISKWDAEVVYGDTDSLFVYLKGRTREQAFDIGEDIAKTITSMNPRPIKLKFEKVYHPCVLLAKKRYVGFKYESRNQKEPDFDAKGIETVRRDGTPAEQKIEEVALKTLFRTADLSQVKSFFQEQCDKIMRGKVSVQDFCFAKEVKLGTYSDKGPPPPGALISARKMAEDHRLEPQYGERVPYVVVTGGPGARLIDRCVSPDVLLRDPQMELDAEYYIGKNLIPPLERIFNLVGANVRTWYDEMPRTQRARKIEVTDAESVLTTATGKAEAITGSNLKKTLESYLKASSCIVCRAPVLPLTTSTSPSLPLCALCLDTDNIPTTMHILQNRLLKSEKRLIDYEKVERRRASLASSGAGSGGAIAEQRRKSIEDFVTTRKATRRASMSYGYGGNSRNVDMSR
ncbi:MAG: hypothetical protein Q9227_001645 [Pyrenula ochraceoflavens]